MFKPLMRMDCVSFKRYQEGRLRMYYISTVMLNNLPSRRQFNREERLAAKGRYI
jgi:hypothetical protein